MTFGDDGEALAKAIILDEDGSGAPLCELCGICDGSIDTEFGLICGLCKEGGMGSTRGA